ncbi:MAG: exosortase/archaeosortase family protein, partial [Candidatus Aenigmarchaeota archaeon]|nr:exosortase/archaeosortase family protein [Candidatus Aenigmarchaeota archaeon]
FVFGVAGTFFSNVLRIVFLFLIGVHIGNDALVAAHTHLGWIFFFLWISLFWTILFKISETIENNPSLKKQKKKYVPENKKQAKILQI